VIGHDLSAKCAVANAICKSRRLFRELNCRMKCLTKVKIVDGIQIQIILTPNMGTPAWSEVESNVIMNRHGEIRIIYVQTFGQSNIDDETSLERLKEIYRTYPLEIVHYFEDEKIMPSECLRQYLTFSSEMEKYQRYEVGLQLVRLIKLEERRNIWNSDMCFQERLQLVKTTWPRKDPPAVLREDNLEEKKGKTVLNYLAVT